MLKKFFIFSIMFLYSFSIFAENKDLKINISPIKKEEILNKININNNLYIKDILKIDLTKQYEELKKKYKTKILFEYNIPGEKTISLPKIEKKFETFGKKEINLNIYKINGKQKELIINKKFEIFVYKNQINTIFDSNLKNSFIDFVKKAKETGILINYTELKSENIHKIKFKDNILKNIDLNNYILVWGEKEFIFDLLSKINSEKINQKINIVGITSFNINILEKYLSNFLSNKNWLNKAILIDEYTKFKVLKEPNNIDKLITILKKNNYNYIVLSSQKKIFPLLFISKFVNNLSNYGFSTQNIYLILVIPFLLVFVSIFKHFIGLTPIGILLPTTLVLLALKIGFNITFSFFILFFIFNFFLSKIVSKYSLHYTPKIVTLIISNISFFILIFNLFINKGYLNLSMNDIILFILFILISERLINIIVSKEFSEYKNSLTNTIIFWIVSYLIITITFIKTLILTYPELILFLIPISFLIGKFTGLRITEYFRFKEIINNIEE